MTEAWPVLLPVLGAYIAHAPVLRFDLLRSLKHPIDGGACWRGRRIFGDNKTWRGVVVMFAGVVAATAALATWRRWWTALPQPLQQAGPLTAGVLLGLGVVLGELPNSFLKRQVNIAPGARRRSIGGVLWSVFDQGDFVLGIWFCFLPIWRMGASQTLGVFLLVVVVHSVVNVVGYAIGARKTLA